MLLTFNPTYVPLILDGTKTITIRKNLRFRVGMELQIWSSNPCAMRYGAHQFATAVVKSAEPFTMLIRKGAKTWVVVWKTGDINLSDIAIRDGFANERELIQYIGKTYAPKGDTDFIFVGQVVQWENFVKIENI
jgi:hypothetical protein